MEEDLTPSEGSPTPNFNSDVKVNEKQKEGGFFNTYASLLRVESKISDLCAAKLRLPELPRNGSMSVKNSKGNQMSPTVSRAYLLGLTKEEQYEKAKNTGSKISLAARFTACQIPTQAEIKEGRFKTLKTSPSRAQIMKAKPGDIVIQQETIESRHDLSSRYLSPVASKAASKAQSFRAHSQKRGSLAQLIKQRNTSIFSQRQINLEKSIIDSGSLKGELIKQQINVNHMFGFPESTRNLDQTGTQHPSLVLPALLNQPSNRSELFVQNLLKKDDSLPEQSVARNHFKFNRPPNVFEKRSMSETPKGNDSSTFFRSANNSTSKTKVMDHHQPPLESEIDLLRKFENSNLNLLSPVQRHQKVIEKMTAIQSEDLSPIKEKSASPKRKKSVSPGKQKATLTVVASRSDASCNMSDEHCEEKHLKQTEEQKDAEIEEKMKDALGILDEVAEINKKKSVSAQILRAYRSKLERVNEQVLDLIFKNTHDINKTTKVLAFQQQLQDKKRHLGFKDYYDVKKEFEKLQEKRIAALRVEQEAQEKRQQAEWEKQQELASQTDDRTGITSRDGPSISIKTVSALEKGEHDMQGTLPSFDDREHPTGPIRVEGQQKKMGQSTKKRFNSTKGSAFKSNKSKPKTATSAGQTSGLSSHESFVSESIQSTSEEGSEQAHPTLQKQGAIHIDTNLVQPEISVGAAEDLTEAGFELKVNLQDDYFVVHKAGHITAANSYPASKFQSLMHFCGLTRDEEVPVHVYPILHQLLHRKVLIKGMTYKKGTWPKLFEKIIQCVDGKLQLVYLEQCRISDNDMQQVVKMLSATRCKELVLVNMNLHQNTCKELNYMQRNLVQQNPHFSIVMKNCKFPFFEKILVNHPLIYSSMLPTRYLSLPQADLRDAHLDLLSARVPALRSLDISLNKFSSDGLYNFLNKIPKLHNKKNPLQLRSLSIACNRMKNIDLTVNKLTELFRGLLTKHSLINHFDVSFIDLEIEVLSNLIKILPDCLSLTSIHLGSPHTQQLKLLAKDYLKHRLYSRFACKDLAGEIDDQWNHGGHIPHREDQDQINQQLCHSLSSHTEKSSHATQYHKKVYILSKVMGRKDLTNNLIEQKRAFSEEKEKQDLGDLHDLCWIESDQCWVCERWSYSLPIFSRKEIDESFPGEVQTRMCLTKTQQRSFDQFLANSPMRVADLEFKTPYIIGVFTDFQFSKCMDFTEYMAVVDPNIEDIKQEHGSEEEGLHSYYFSNYERVFSRSAINHMAEKDKRDALYPYEPVVHPKPEELSTNDKWWVHPMLLRPGSHSYFLVYRLDSTSMFVTQYSTVAPVRSQCTQIHNYRRPVPDRLKDKQKEFDPMSQYYFHIFNSWRQDDLVNLAETFAKDNKLWDNTSLIQLMKEGSEDLEAVKSEIKFHLLPLMSTYRFLLASSAGYPLIAWKPVRDWLNAINFVTEAFQISDCEEIFAKIKDIVKTIHIKGKKDTKKKSVTRSKSKEAHEQRLKNRIYFNRKDRVVATNQLTRPQFYEFLVTIAVKKYTMTGMIGLKEGAYMTPAQCVKKLCELDIIKPLAAEHWFLKNINQYKDLMRNVLYGSSAIQKFLFLNQFNMNAIFRILFKMQIGEFVEKDRKEKSAANFKTNMQKGLAKLVQKRKQEVDDKIEQRNRIYGNLVSGKSTQVKQTDENKLSLGRTGSDDKFNKEVKKEESPVAKKPKKTLKGSVKTVINLKKSTVAFQNNVLDQNHPEKTLTKEFLYSWLKDVFADKAAKIHLDTFRFIFAYAKQTYMYLTEQTKQSMEKDTEKMGRLTFIEFFLLMCFLTVTMYAEEMLGFDSRQEGYLNALEQMFKDLFSHYDHEVVKAPAEEEENKPERKGQLKDIMLDGEIVDFVPPTAESKRESIYPDMFSSFYTQQTSNTIPDLQQD